MEQKKVAGIVREVLLSEPSLYKCLEMGVLNYSKVASKLKPVVSRLVGRDVSVESIKMALVRLRSKVTEQPPVASREVLGVLANSRVEVRTGVVIVIVGSGYLQSTMAAIAKVSSKARFMAIMQSGFATTIVLDEESANELIGMLDKKSIIEVQRDQAAIVVVSPRDVMWVPGVIAYITGVLAQNGINIVHIESCYTDTVIVVSREELLTAFNTLVKHIEIAKALLAKAS